MRKLVTIFSIISGGIFTLFLLLPVLLSALNLDKVLADYFVDKFTKNGEKIINFGRINVGYQSIELDDIQFISQAAGIHLVVRGLEFEYNIFDLLRNIKTPHKAISKIHFLEPKIVFKQPLPASDTEPADIDTSHFDISLFVNQFENIDRIYLKEGQILFERKAGELVILAKNLEGWLDANDLSKIHVQAFGDLLYGTEKNFTVNCDIDPIAQKFFATFSLDKFDMRNFRRIEDGDQINVTGGTLNGELKISGTRFELDSISTSGNLYLDDLSLNLFDLNIANVSIPLKIVDNSVIINNGSGMLDSSGFMVNGNIPDIFNPGFQGTLVSNALNLNSFAAYIDTSLLKDIVVKMDAGFIISESNFHIDAAVSAPEIRIQSQVFTDLHFETCLKDGKLSIPQLNVKIMDFALSGTGEIDLTDADYHAGIKVWRDFGEHVFLDRISQGTHFAKLVIKGNLTDKSLDGRWNYHIESSSDTVFAVTGNTELKEGVFNFQTVSSSVPSFTFSAQVDNIFDIPTIRYGYVRDLPYYLLSSRKWLADFASQNTIEGVLRGPVNDLKFEVSVNGKSYRKSKLSLSANVKDILSEEKKVTGQLSLDRFYTDFDLDIGASFIRGEFNANGSLRGLVDIDMQREEQVNSSIHLNGFSIGKLLEDSTFQDNGKVYGLIEVGGTMDNPKLTADLNGDQFIINDIGYYNFSLAVSADTSMVNVDTMEISLNNASVLSGNLSLDIVNSEINAKATGKQIDADYLFQTLFHKKNMITGYGDYQLAISGPVSSPKIFSDISIRNGEFGDIPFDDVQLSVSDSVASDSSFFSYENHLINIREFVVVKAGMYHFEGAGKLPVYSDGQIDLNLKFDGDFFYFLPKLEPFFTDGACFSTIEIDLEGTPSRLKIRNGYAEFDRGELWMKSVVDHVENISGRIELLPGTEQVKISNVYGEVDGRSLVINNVPSVVTSDGQTLDPWIFKDLNLDFGILTMETPDGGVSLQIPSFMIEGEHGEISITGKTDQEKFYFAGPVRKPHVWGSAVLANSRITFPFISSDQSEPSATVKFLMGVHWDLDVFAGKDLEYLRRIPAFLGEVDTEVGIDPRSEGLHLVGVIRDKTFKPHGGLQSSRGRIDYLDLNFRVENFGVLFKSSEEMPEVYGRAWTTVRDSVGAVPKTIYLELYAIDQSTGQETMRARWEDFRFRLVSADPTIGETQEQVLAYLGYSVENIREKASQVGGAVTNNYIIRPLLRPLERNIEKYLGMDLVRFNSGLAKNLFMVGLGQSYPTNNYKSAFMYNSMQPYALLLQSSEVTVGKYLSKDLYLFYTGQVVASSIDNTNEFNFNHSVGLEYRFLQNLLVEFEYYRENFRYYQMYTDKLYLEDFKIRLRHSFAF